MTQRDAFSPSPELRRLDGRIIAWMQAHGITLLRVALATVFLWFGLLKILGVSPAFQLVAKTIPWFNPDLFVPLLGIWEVIIGIGLLIRVALRLTLVLFALQMAGTFLVLILQPQIAFAHGNLFLLTLEGEFVIKNLVLLSSGIVIGSTVHRLRRG